MTSIAIDGPSGSGKSTLAKALSERFGFLYIDTGALYRAIGYDMLQNGIDPKDAERVGETLPRVAIRIQFIDGRQRIFLRGRDVTEEIRSPQVSMAASDVSAHSAVRRFLLETQRSFAKENDVIMDGRDIGTVVLPDATIKIFLTADVRERADRRREQLAKKGISEDYDSVLRDMEQRDYNDSHRELAPLKAAKNAVCVDTTGQTLSESYESLCKIIEGRISGESYS